MIFLAESGETGQSSGVSRAIPTTCSRRSTVTDAQGRWAVYVPLRMDGKIGCPKRLVDSAAAAYPQIAAARGGCRRTVAVGTEIAPRPPHRSVRAAFPHTA